MKATKPHTPVPPQHCKNSKRACPSRNLCKLHSLFADDVPQKQPLILNGQFVWVLRFSCTAHPLFGPPRRPSSQAGARQPELPHHHRGARPRPGGAAGGVRLQQHHGVRLGGPDAVLLDGRRPLRPAGGGACGAYGGTTVHGRRCWERRL